MRRRSREGDEVFGMSFLDVISCGFAAMVAILMLAKQQPDPVPVEPVPELNVAQPETFDFERIASFERQVASEVRRSVELIERELALTQQLAGVEQDVRALTDKIGAATMEATKKGTIDSPYDGGIPVDATHVVFVIDSSGSMRSNWQQVADKVNQLLSIHPQVTAIQVLSDMGESLIPGYNRKWIPDTPAARKNFNQSLANMSAFSNSSPVEGIEQALRIYAPKAEKLAIYVLGDDFTGGDFEAALQSVDQLNIKDGERVARIHAIGFPWGQGDRFSTLMREMAHRNNGVFLAL